MTVNEILMILIATAVGGIGTWAWTIQGRTNRNTTQIAILHEQMLNNTNRDNERDGNYKEIISDLRQVLDRLTRLEAKVDAALDKDNKKK